MSSPFTIFRQYQRTLMVVITGLSMISFLLLGAVNDPRQMPAPLIVVLLAAMIGGVAWLAGMSRGKGGEWGFTGALIGAIIGVVGVFYNREASAVLIDNGNLSSQQVSDLRQQRYLVNRFVNTAFQQTFSLPLQYLPAAVQRNFVFGFGNSEEISVQDVVVGELLRREADRMGIVISDKVVMDYIKQITSKKGLQEFFDRAKGQISPQEAAMWGFQLQRMEPKAMTAEAFTKIRQSLPTRPSEQSLINAFRNELKVRQAYQLLSGNNYFPPEQFWSYFQKMNVKQSADIASIDVKDFIDLDAKPSDADLLKLFDEYKANYPGFTTEGAIAPGRPGFYQPRRFQLGYLQADYELIEPLAGAVTDEEIQKRYEELYLKEVPEAEMPAAGTLDGPELPPAPSTDKPATAPEAAPAENMPAEKPAEAAPKSETPTPEKPETPAPESTEKPAETPAPETKPEPAPSEEAPKTESGESTSMLNRMPATQLVAFLQDAAPAEQPAAPEAPAPKTEDAPTAETPAEKPAAPETPATPPAPTEDKPAEPAAENMPAPTSDPAAPVDIPPAPPTTEVPPLDDALKARLRDEILKERTKKIIEQRMEAAQIEMSTVSELLQREKTDKDYLSQEAATKRLELYAAQNQLTYVVTPFMSYQELAESEDFSIGQAMLPQRMTVADSLYRSLPTDLYRVAPAADFKSSDAFVFWKLADKADYIPSTLEDDPGLRAAVTEAWNLQQARPKAQARAEALAKMIRESDKPVAEALAEQTVTGTENSLFIPVRQSGEFTWMQKPGVAPTNLNPSQAVRPSIVLGAPDAGEEFFQKVFEDLKVGESGVAPNNDHTTYYVVKIDSRDPSNPEQLETMEKKFLSEGMQGGYSSLLQQTMSENSINWLQQMFDDHEVVILQPQLN